jgi:hypothetical protein
MVRRGLILLRASAVAVVLTAAAAHSQNPLARGDAPSPPDCARPADMVTEYDPAPFDRTYMRVQHIGDPGTAELAGQVANDVTWAVQGMTGIAVPAGAQRGYRDEAQAASAFQLWCNAAGAFIDTWSFSHRAPLVGEGPSASVARDFTQALPVFRDGGSMVIEGTIRIPWIRNQRPPVDAGTAQVSFFYYAQDTRSGKVIAHLLAIFENRAPGVNGAGVENWGDDGNVAFVSSPIASEDANGNAVRFLSYSPANPAMQFREPFAEPRTYRARISAENFRAALDVLRAGPAPEISGDPADYRVISFGLLAEVFPGTGDEDNVSLGVSVVDLVLRRVPGHARH